jgi:hypothetical protein
VTVALLLRQCRINTTNSTVITIKATARTPVAVARATRIVDFFDGCFCGNKVFSIIELEYSYFKKKLIMSV